MPLYRVYNGAMATSAKQAPIATGTSIKTMLQMKGIAALMYKVKAWGVSMDGAAGAAGVQWELLETGTVFGTSATAFVAADILGVDAMGVQIASTTYFSVGTSASGYAPSAEGTIVASRMFDSQIVQPTGQYAWEFSLGNEPVISAVSCLRIRCHAPASVNALCWLLLEV